MKTQVMQAWGALAVFGLVLALGCTQGGAENPPTYPVSGIVTYNGEPVEGAQVVFAAQGGGQGAVGTTDASGNFTMTTYQAGDGAEPGQYNVKITKFAGSAPEAEGETEEEYTGATEDDYWVPENELPEKYADPTTSELTASVTEGPNTINFELTD